MPNIKVGYVSPVGEFNPFPSFVEIAGYRTARQQIESFMFAGEILRSSRQGQYDSDDFDPVEDPSLRVRDMELSELGQILSKVDTPKVEFEEETGVSVSSSSESDDKSSVQDPS